jgi:hypothetical protein
MTIIFVIVLFGFVGFILSLLALIFGAISFFGRHKDKFGLIGFILGIIFLVMSLIAPSMATYTFVVNMASPEHEMPPSIAIYALPTSF